MTFWLAPLILAQELERSPPSLFASFGVFLYPRVGVETILVVLFASLVVSVSNSSRIRCPCSLLVLVGMDPSRDVTGKRKEVKIKYTPKFHT